MGAKINNFTDLTAYQETHTLVLSIYEITKKFPREEQFGLTNQLRRAAVSATSNIAEGFGRNTAKDKAQFYAVAKGSLLEIQSQLLVAKDLGYIKQEIFDKHSASLENAVKLVSGLVRSAISR